MKMILASLLLSLGLLAQQPQASFFAVVVPPAAQPICPAVPQLKCDTEILLFVNGAMGASEVAFTVLYTSEGVTKTAVRTLPVDQYGSALKTIPVDDDAVIVTASAQLLTNLGPPIAAQN